MGASIQHHVREEFGLVNLTGLGARNSDSDGHLVVDQIRQIIVGTVSGFGLNAEISLGISPMNAIVDEKQVRLMSFGMGNLGKLETSCGRLVVILAQNK
jgi:hypothetical protein